MGPYLPFFSVQVEHDFFTAGLGPGLDFVPAPATPNVLKNAGLLPRTRPDGLWVFYDAARLESLQRHAADADPALVLGFKAFARDPFFRHYSEPAVYPDDVLLYFDNRAGADDPSGRRRLHAAAAVSAADFEPLTAPRLDAILGKADRLRRPLFVVDIWVAPGTDGLLNARLEVAPRAYCLKFQARRTFWKYYLLGDLARDDVEIADLDQETEFEFLGPEALSDQRQALAFRSRTPIPLRQRSDRRFQLRTRNAGGKVLIRRLPVAAAGQIKREVVGAEPAIVSEVFVNC